MERLMLRIITIVALVMIAYFTIKSKFFPPGRPAPRKRAPSPKPESGLKDAGEMARDPVCGTYISVDNAPSLVHEGSRVFFCSEECMREFMEGRT